MYVLEDEHLEDQAIKIKKLYYSYGARVVVIDANGLGAGLMDYMVKRQEDPDTGEELADFGVQNDDNNEYKRFKTDYTELDAIYQIKANIPINSEMHGNALNQLRAGRVRLLVDEKVAKNKLLTTKKGQSMKPEERNIYLRPFVYTSILRDEMLNLREESEGINIILKQVNKTLGKDKFSSFEMGLYYIKLEEDSKKKKKRGRFSEFMFIG